MFKFNIFLIKFYFNIPDNNYKYLRPKNCNNYFFNLRKNSL